MQLAQGKFSFPHCKETARSRGLVRRSATGAAQKAQPVTKEDLVAYIKAGCKPRSRWRIGTEHEKLGFYTDTGRRLEYQAIQRILEGLCQRHDWEPIMEGEYIIGANFDGQSVTIEPGGQFELSGAPVESLHETRLELRNHIEQVKQLASEQGAGFLALGFDPRWSVKDVPIMPKNRYRIMRDYMPTVGGLGHDMMFRSTTIQVNLDFEDEKDMVEKVRIGLALQPIATALFSNSPFKDGGDTGYLSWRSHVWEDVDPSRCGILPFVWEDDFGFERYTEFALDVPMYFAYRDSVYLDATRQRTTFREFLNGELPILPGEQPSLKDWEVHLTTIFPEVRLKRYIEMRGGDGGPEHMVTALSALWVGLLYCRESQAAASSLIRDWTLEDHQHLRSRVPRSGLRTKFRDGYLRDVAEEVLRIAHRGLEERGLNEEQYLQPLDAVVKSGKSQSQLLLEKYNGPWGHTIDPVYEEYRF